MSARLTDEQARFLKFHLLRPAPHAWAWDGQSFSDAKWFTARRYLRGKRGPTETCVISREGMAGLGELGVWSDVSAAMQLSDEGRRQLLEHHLEAK